MNEVFFIPMPVMLTCVREHTRMIAFRADPRVVLSQQTVKIALAESTWITFHLSEVCLPFYPSWSASHTRAMQSEGCVCVSVKMHMSEHS